MRKQREIRHPRLTFQMPVIADLSQTKSKSPELSPHLPYARQWETWVFESFAAATLSAWQQEAWVVMGVRRQPQARPDGLQASLSNIFADTPNT